MNKETATKAKAQEEKKKVAKAPEKKAAQKKNEKVAPKKGDKNKKNTKKKEEKKSLGKRIIGFFVDVKNELKKVHFPNRKDMIKYSLATLCFVVFFSLFFYLIDIIFAFVKSLFQ